MKSRFEKRTLSIILSIIMISTMLVSFSPIMVNATDPTLYVKVIGDFENATKISELQPCEWTGFFNQTVAANTINFDRGTQGAKITLVNASTSVGLGKMIWAPSAGINLSEADYAQFYVKNSGSVPLSIGALGFDSFVVTAQNYNQTNDPTFWSQHLGALYFATSHNFSAYPAEVFTGYSWELASKEAVTGFTNSVLTIKAGYEGYIRIPLGASEKISGNRGMGFQIQTKDANAAGLVLSIDSFSIVTRLDKSGDGTFSTLTNYINASSAPVQNYVNVIGDFETTAKINALQPAEYTTFFNQTVAADTTNYDRGTQGAKITLVNASTDVGLGRMLWDTSASPINMSSAKYFMFYAKNNGSVPIAFSGIGFNSFIVTPDNVNQTDNPSFWDDHYGAVYSSANHDFSANPAQVYNGYRWVNASTEAVTGFASPSFTLPAGFDGIVRLPLSTSEKLASSKGMCFLLVTKDANAQGLVLSMDNYALIGSGSGFGASTLSSYLSASNSTFNYSGGDPMCYNYATDTFYNQTNIYSTWINIWNGSTEAWWSSSDYNGTKVLVDGTWQAIDMNNATHRAKFFNDAKDAGVDNIIIDATNGLRWESQSRDFQRMCYENGMKFCVAINATSGITQFNEECAQIWNTYARPEIQYSDAYLFKDGKPLVVFYTVLSNYNTCTASTDFYAQKFTYTWASGEDSAADKWGWQIEPQDGPQASSDSMYTTCSIDWNSPYGSQDSWRKSLALMDFCMLAAKQNSPQHVIVGSMDDQAERNGWGKDTDTTNSIYNGLKMRDIYGNISNNVYYDRVKQWITQGNASAYNAGGLIADGAYTMTNVYANKKFGVIRPTNGNAEDISANLKLNYNVSTNMETYYWFYHLGNNEYRIIKLSSGLSLNASGTNVILSWDANTNTQVWQLQAVSGKYVLTNKSTGKSMNFASSANNTNLTLATKNINDTKQRFTITAVANRTIG